VHPRHIDSDLLQSYHDADRSDANHWQQAVAENGSNTVCINALFRHQVEEGIKGNCAKKRDAIDIIKVRLSGLRNGLEYAIGTWHERLTKRREIPKQKQKKMGPARSASSIMCSSTRRRGLRTVNDLSRICWKLMPSSARYEKRFGFENLTRKTFKKRGLALYAACAKRGPPCTLGLNVASKGWRLLGNWALDLAIKTCSRGWIVSLGLCVKLERFLVIIWGGGCVIVLLPHLAVKSQCEHVLALQKNIESCLVRPFVFCTHGKSFLKIQFHHRSFLPSQTASGNPTPHNSI